MKPHEYESMLQKPSNIVTGNSTSVRFVSVCVTHRLNKETVKSNNAWNKKKKGSVTSNFNLPALKKSRSVLEV